MRLSKKAKIIYLSTALMVTVPSLAIAQPKPEIPTFNQLQQEQFDNSWNMSALIINRFIEQQEREAKIQEEIQEAEAKQQREAQIKAQQLEKIKQVKYQKQQEANKFIQLVTSVNKVITIDLTTPSGLTTEEADMLLQGTGLEGLGKDFVKAEETYGVNAVYLMAHAAWESGWGTSSISKTKNNLFGFGAYDDSPTKSAITFETKGDCILAVAKYISEHYLDEEGDHYNGPTLKGMNIKYASDEAWAEGISSVMISLMNKKDKRSSI